LATGRDQGRIAGATTELERSMLPVCGEAVSGIERDAKFRVGVAVMIVEKQIGRDLRASCFPRLR
jgi:hypothetical protein